MKIDQSDGIGAPNVIVVERLESRLASWAIGVLGMFGDVRYARCNTSSIHTEQLQPVYEYFSTTSTTQCCCGRDCCFTSTREDYKTVYC